MSRPLRLQFPGARYHVFARGNARQLLFVDDQDRRDFLRLLARIVARYKVRCAGYCLMSNHYHLLLETVDSNLSLAMHGLNGVYAQRFNRRHGLVGHVFDGRFGSVLIEDESQFLEASRYVVLNPVRAGIVERPEDWQWSSYRVAAGLAPEIGFVEADSMLRILSADLELARRLYRTFVNDPATVPGGDLELIRGTSSFVRSLEPQLRVHRHVVEFTKRERFAARPSLAEIFSAVGSCESRRRAVHAARHEHGYLLREIAAHLGVHYTTVSKLAGGMFGVRS